MITSLMIFHAVVSTLLVLMVLLQFGKGAEAGLMSGGAGSDQVFSGATQGNILTHITTVLAVLFLANSILLAKLQSERSSTSIMDDETPISRPLNQDNKAKEAPKAEKNKPAEAKAKTK